MNTLTQTHTHARTPYIHSYMHTCMHANIYISYIYNHIHTLAFNFSFSFTHIQLHSHSHIRLILRCRHWRPSRPAAWPGTSSSTRSPPCAASLSTVPRHAPFTPPLRSFVHLFLHTITNTSPPFTSTFPYLDSLHVSFFNDFSHYNLQQLSN